MGKPRREVLRGAQLLLECPSLRAVIVEVWDGSRDEVHRILAGQGFAPHTYDPATREIAPRATAAAGNVLYIRDPKWLALRCQTAPRRLVQSVGKWL